MNRKDLSDMSLEEVADFTAEAGVGDKSMNAHRGEVEFVYRQTKAIVETTEATKRYTLYMLLSVVVLALSSVTALVIEGSREVPAGLSVDEAVDAALAEREKSLVQGYAAQFEVIYRDMMGPGYFDGFEDEPETIEELFAPAVSVIKQITGSE